VSLTRRIVDLHRRYLAHRTDATFLRSSHRSTFQILFYALRPGFIRSQKPTWYHLLNAVFILAADFVLVKSAGWAPLLYLLFSSFFAGSLHPCAAHFIAEHYLMSEVASEVEAVDPQGHEVELDHVRALSQETTSYYGWLNVLCYNVGYHNEHHDFPSVPWTRLPQLREMAKEFYDPLPVHKSWPAVTWKFISDPRVGMWSRAKRQAGDKGERIDESAWKACERAKSTTGEDPVVILKNGSEDEAMDKLMSEAVERGYGSDAE
jgi:sphingolipid delta-4 desaturase